MGLGQDLLQHERVHSESALYVGCWTLLQVNRADEFGLYGSFYDDSRDKTYQSFYRSDRKFEAEIYLDHLRIDEQL
jgi:hypothetical protein